jgi:hypothetical protein
MSNNRRYYRIADITIQVDSDLPILDTTFSSAINQFQIDEPGTDIVTIHHHFSLPDLSEVDLGKEVYHNPPWSIYKQTNKWSYLGISPYVDDKSLDLVAYFYRDYTNGIIHNVNDNNYSRGNSNSLTFFPSDQVLISQLLADRNGFFLHSAGAILNGKGFLFVGHSEAGKSTTTQLLMNADQRSYNQSRFEVEILCDDRNIVRRLDEGWRVYGSWSHGDIPDVSPSSSPLNAICFIEKSTHNEIVLITDKKEIRHRLISHVIKAFVTTEWWNSTLTMIEMISNEVPCYIMNFDKSGAIIPDIAILARLTYCQNNPISRNSLNG